MRKKEGIGDKERVETSDSFMWSVLRKCPGCEYLSVASSVLKQAGSAQVFLDLRNEFN